MFLLIFLYIAFLAMENHGTDHADSSTAQTEACNQLIELH